MTRQVEIGEAIRVALENNLPFYAYRNPDEEIEFGLQLSSLAQRLEGDNGFVVYPFIETEQTPALFIKQEYSLNNFPLQVAKRSVEYPQCNTEITYTEYKESASKLIGEMQAGRYQKTVLSRTIGCEVDTRNKVSEWFLSLCNTYPNAYVYIFSVPHIATWIGATPEKLLEYDGNRVSTMALAATRRVNDKRNFTQKEEREQQIVADYITDKFNSLALNIKISPRFVKTAGPVEHLCNIISADGVCKEKADHLLSLLHPTPAVAGTPLDKALEAIIEVEKRQRRYYSGYLGGVKENNTFSLFVNLRSMEIFPNRVQLYVGGGLTSQSKVEDEWNETEHKAQTLLYAIKE
ncbi:MAG: chorismate-binding protein [Bacteroidales bacterium]|nr:chorismate-binding protein [Bacteroidales bacterium]